MSSLGVLLMTYGSPDGPAEVPGYLSRVRRGRAVSDELVAEFTRRYAIIGGSPLIRITREQAAALQQQLGGDAVVDVGMRFSEPTIAQGLAMLVGAGARRVVGVILSPQYSPMLMGGYQRDLDAAREGLGGAAPEIFVAGAWHRTPAFVDALAQRVGQALGRFPALERDGVPVVFTAHSLPRRVADQEPEYIAQLSETAVAAAAAAAIASDRWRFAWQSAGHEPGDWMKPDLAELLGELRAAGHRSLLVVPVQFLADHLEVLYDLDVAARQQADAAGMRFERIESLNTMPRFIEALAAVVGETAGTRVGGRTAVTEGTTWTGS